MDELPIIIDSCSSSSSPFPVEIAETEEDLDLPKVKLSDICSSHKRPHSISSSSEENDSPIFDEDFKFRNVTLKPNVDGFDFGETFDPDVPEPIGLSADDENNCQELSQKPSCSSATQFDSQSQSSSSYDITSFISQLRTDSQNFEQPKSKLAEKQQPSGFLPVHSLSSDSDDNEDNRPFELSQKPCCSSAGQFDSQSQRSSSYDVTTVIFQATTDSQKPEQPKSNLPKKRKKQFKPVFTFLLSLLLNNNVHVCSRADLSKVSNLSTNFNDSSIPGSGLRGLVCLNHLMTNYVTVIVDKSIIAEYPWGSHLVENLKESKVSHEIATNQYPCTVKWRRIQSDEAPLLEEQHCLFVWTCDKVITCVKTETLLPTFEDVKEKFPDHKVYLAIYGRLKKDRTRIETELITLQINWQISYRILNTPEDATVFVLSLTKSITELPSKLAQEQLDMDRDWYARGDSKKCVRIDKDFNGLEQLWLQQLSQFNNSNLDTAKAIAAIYPFPLALYNAYDKLSTAKEKERMLQDIVVARNRQGGRRLGPELSRKISLLFCQDEDVSLNS